MVGAESVGVRRLNDANPIGEAGGPTPGGTAFELVRAWAYISDCFPWSRAISAPDGRVASQANHGNREVAAMRRPAVFKQKDSLPRAKRHPPTVNRNDFARSREHHPQVGRQVIRALSSVHEVVLVLRTQAFEERVEIGLRARVGVLVDDERCAGVLDEHRDRSILHSAGSHDLRNLVGNLVGALAAG